MARVDAKIRDRAGKVALAAGAFSRILLRASNSLTKLVIAVVFDRSGIQAGTVSVLFLLQPIALMAGILAF